LLGLGLGVIGLCLSDFDAMTPSEFNHVCEAFDNYSTHQYRSSWVRTRFIAKCIFQVNSKKTINDKDIVVFEWEKNNDKNEIKLNSKDAFEQALKRFGDGK
jgi:hypothetical protein